MSLAASSTGGQQLAPNYQSEVCIPTQHSTSAPTPSAFHTRSPQKLCGRADPAGSIKDSPRCCALVQVLGLLLQSCDSEEECRNVVAECLGHLALLAPPQIVPVLQQRAGAGSAPMRATVVMAVKHTLVDQPHAVDGLLATSLPTFLALLSDPDRCAPSLPRSPGTPSSSPSRPLPDGQSTRSDKGSVVCGLCGS